MIFIVPAVLEFTLHEALKRIETLSFFPRIHLDVLDGKFVKSKVSFWPSDLSRLPVDYTYELHLMVDDPMPWLEWVKPLPHVTTLLVHAESKVNIEDVLAAGKAANKDIAVVLNPNTDPAKTLSYAIALPMLMFMGVEPGAQGQAMLPETASRMKIFHEQNPSVRLGVDGGVNPTTIPAVVAAGAIHLVVGSAIVHAEDPQAAYQSCVQAVQTVRP